MPERLSKPAKQWFPLLFLLIFSGAVAAKKNKIRSCTLPSGEVVLMDKACPKRSTTQAYQKPAKSKISTAGQRRWHQKTTQASTNTKKSKAFKPRSSQQSTTNVQHQAALSLPLNRLLASVKAPNGWFVQSFKVPRGDVITAGPKRLIRPNALKTGVTLARFTNTFEHFKKDAFSVAIDQFHDIRFDDKNELIESEFIAHERFKVFNVHYKKNRLRQKTVRYLVQFYVDEKNNDLYVMEFKAPNQHWQRLTQVRQRLFQSINI